VISPDDITLIAFTPATSGTATNLSGANGLYSYTVTIQKGAHLATTLATSGVIIATPYAATPVSSIELLLLGDTTVRLLNTGNIPTGNLTAILSGANAGVFTLSSASPGSLPTGGETDLTVSPRAGLAPGNYTATLTVSGEGLPSSASLTLTYRVAPTDNEAIAGNKVWSAGNTLYIAALTTGQAHIYSMGGQLVKSVACHAGETITTTLARGFYLVIAEDKTYKVMISD
jgi:hypothetical protein